MLKFCNSQRLFFYNIASKLADQGIYLYNGFHIHFWLFFLVFYNQRLSFISCLWVFFLHECMCILCVKYLVKPDEGIGYPWSGSTYGRKPPCRCWNQTQVFYKNSMCSWLLNGFSSLYCHFSRYKEHDFQSIKSCELCQDYHNLDFPCISHPSLWITFLELQCVYM